MRRLGLLLATLGLLCGCSTGSKMDPDKDKLPKVYKIQTQQLPPPPTYSRLRWANMSPLPSRELPVSSAPLLTPVIQFEARNTKLEEAARMLAATAQYSSYCASTIATQKITLNRLGTIDELGEAISRQAGIKVVVDHEGHSVRFFPQQTETPQFFGPAASK
jgi:hypothetical protein